MKFPNFSGRGQEFPTIKVHQQNAGMTEEPRLWRACRTFEPQPALAPPPPLCDNRGMATHQFSLSRLLWFVATVAVALALWRLLGTVVTLALA